MASTDHVYPIHTLDGTKLTSSIIVRWTLRFEDVLDPAILRESLGQLLEMGDWRKLSGRLRSKPDGTREIHVPQVYTEDRPAFTYSYQQEQMPIREHPLASQLPAATDAPSVQQDLRTFDHFATKSDAPTSIKAYVDTDLPQLSLHITSFVDETLVGLSWPHSLMDALGQQALLHAWSLVMAGRKSEVPPLLGADTDIVKTIVQDSASETHTRGITEAAMSTLSILTFGLRLGWEILTSPAMDTRIMFLPAAAMSQLRKQAAADLQGDYDQPPFLSDGDILTAWMTRLITTGLAQNRPVTIVQVVNARQRVPQLKDCKGLHVQNLALPAFVFLSRDTAAGPIGKTALKHRQYLNAQTSASGVVACMEEVIDQEANHPNSPTIYGPSNAVLIPVTNWSKADIYSINFAAAVTSNNRTADNERPVGRIVYHHASSPVVNPAARNVVVIYGKDMDGGYWLSGAYLPKVWARIERACEELKQAS